MGNQELQSSGHPGKKAQIPIEQVSVPFYGHELVAVRMEDGQIAAVLRWLCEGMGLNQQSQLRHIRGRQALACGLVDVQVDTAGGPQVMSALTLDVMPGWLFTVDERRVKAEAQADVVRFQQEAVQVLAAHFTQPHSPTPALPAPVALTETMPVAPTIAANAGPSERRVWRQLMREWLDRLDELDTWRMTTESRVEAVEGRVETVEGQVSEIARIIPEIVERLGEQPLTAAHQGAIQQGANLIHDALGVPHATLYNELRRQFKVAKYDQIPDARWDDVVAWFRPRITAARRQMATKGTLARDPFADDSPAQGRLF